MLENIVKVASTLPFGTTFVPLYLLCFFSFLRLSNILPHTVNSFDITRQLARGDVLHTDTGAIVIIKWSKTLQDRKTTTTITIPDLGSSPLCPVKALQRMCKAIPADKNSPLFLLKRPTKISVLTDSVARKHLKEVSKILKCASNLTFHAFRKAGATWAFQHGVPLEHIKTHGTWASDAVYTYLNASTSLSSPVASAFRTALHS